MAVKAESGRVVGELGVQRLAAEYVALREEAARLKARQDEIKSLLFGWMDDHAEPDESGASVLVLDEPVGGIRAVKRERRVTRKQDDDACERILTERGLMDECAPPVPVVDRALVWAAFEDDRLTEADIDAMFAERVVYAMVAVKE